MRVYRESEARNIEAMTGQSWLAAELSECIHLHNVALPYLERIRQDDYILRLAQAALDTGEGYRVEYTNGRIIRFH